MTQDKAKTLENQVSELTARVVSLEEQLEEQTELLQAARIMKRKAPPQTDVPAPDGFVYLHDFFTLHNVPYHIAVDIFPDKIRGKEVTIGKYKYPVIGQFGRRDFWVQLNRTHGYEECENCPHQD